MDSTRATERADGRQRFNPSEYVALLKSGALNGGRVSQRTVEPENVQPLNSAPPRPSGVPVTNGMTGTRGAEGLRSEVTRQPMYQSATELYRASSQGDGMRSTATVKPEEIKLGESSISARNVQSVIDEVKKEHERRRMAKGSDGLSASLDLNSTPSLASSLSSASTAAQSHRVGSDRAVAEPGEGKELGQKISQQVQRNPIQNRVTLNLSSRGTWVPQSNELQSCKFDPSSVSRHASQQLDSIRKALTQSRDTALTPDPLLLEARQPLTRPAAQPRALSPRPQSSASTARQPSATQPIPQPTYRTPQTSSTQPLSSTAPQPRTYNPRDNSPGNHQVASGASNSQSSSARPNQFNGMTANRSYPLDKSMEKPKEISGSDGLKEVRSRLPDGWEMKLDTPSGRVFYVNHDLKAISWERPTDQQLNYFKAKMEQQAPQNHRPADPTPVSQHRSVTPQPMRSSAGAQSRTATQVDMRRSLGPGDASTMSLSAVSSLRTEPHHVRHEVTPRRGSKDGLNLGVYQYSQPVQRRGQTPEPRRAETLNTRSVLDHSFDKGSSLGRAQQPDLMRRSMDAQTLRALAKEWGEDPADNNNSRTEARSRAPVVKDETLDLLRQASEKLWQHILQRQEPVTEREVIMGTVEDFDAFVKNLSATAPVDTDESPMKVAPAGYKVQGEQIAAPKSLASTSRSHSLKSKSGEHTEAAASATANGAVNVDMTWQV